MTDEDGEIAAVVSRERPKLGNFIRRRVIDPADADDILQDVFYEFVAAYRLSASIEQASAWLFRVARNRIIDRFRKKKEVPAAEIAGPEEDEDNFRFELSLPSPDAGPEAEYARSVLLDALSQALAELPGNQREVFVAHELEGRSFKEMAADSGVGVNTLLARKRSAVLHLRARLQPAFDELDI